MNHYFLIVCVSFGCLLCSCCSLFLMQLILFNTFVSLYFWVIANIYKHILCDITPLRFLYIDLFNCYFTWFVLIIEMCTNMTSYKWGFLYMRLRKVKYCNLLMSGTIWIWETGGLLSHKDSLKAQHTEVYV